MIYYYPFSFTVFLLIDKSKCNLISTIYTSNTITVTNWTYNQSSQSNSQTSSQSKSQTSSQSTLSSVINFTSLSTAESESTFLTSAGSVGISTTKIFNNLSSERSFSCMPKETCENQGCKSGYSCQSIERNNKTCYECRQVLSDSSRIGITVISSILFIGFWIIIITCFCNKHCWLSRMINEPTIAVCEDLTADTVSRPPSLWRKAKIPTRLIPADSSSTSTARTSASSAAKISPTKSQKQLLHQSSSSSTLKTSTSKSQESPWSKIFTSKASASKSQKQLQKTTSKSQKQLQKTRSKSQKQLQKTTTKNLSL